MGLEGLKGVIALHKKAHLRVTERHLSYGIMQCYLPPNTGEHPLP